MRRLRYHAAVFLFLVATLASLAAWDSPLAPWGLWRDFSGPWQQELMPALVLESPEGEEGNTPATLMDRGTLVYARSRDMARARVPWGLAEAVVADHPGGYRMLYGGLGDLAPSLRPGNVQTGAPILERGTVLGSLAPGHLGLARALWLQVRDPVRGLNLNPLLFLSQGQDKRRPSIVELRGAPGPIEPRVRLQPRMEALSPQLYLEATIRDSGLGFEQRNPFVLPAQASLRLNGIEVATYQRQALVVRNGRWAGAGAAPNPTPATVTADGALYFGVLRLREGLNLVEIQASDMAGNVSSAVYRITLVLTEEAALSRVAP